MKKLTPTGRLPQRRPWPWLREQPRTVVPTDFRPAEERILAHMRQQASHIAGKV